MRLIETASGRVVDLDVFDAVRCPICDEWFHRGYFRGSYCIECRKDYNKWRARQIRFEKINLQQVRIDTSVNNFRDLYRAGMLEDDLTIWTMRPGEDYPPGAIT